MQSTLTLEDWISILRGLLDESYPLDQGKSQKIGFRTRRGTCTGATGSRNKVRIFIKS